MDVHANMEVHGEKVATYGTFELNGVTHFFTGGFDKAMKFWSATSDESSGA